jgi:hypothetical protein
MVRQYPRFIYSDPQDTKSAGPFIVHTLYPQLIAKVTFTQEGFHQVAPLSMFTAADDMQIDEVMYAMHNWYTDERMKESNLSPDFYERTSNISHEIVRSQFFGTVTISSTFKPAMGATLEVGKDDWKVEIVLADEDTFHSVVMKLKEEYWRKYDQLPDWPLLVRP